MSILLQISGQFPSGQSLWPFIFIYIFRLWL